MVKLLAKLFLFFRYLGKRPLGSLHGRTRTRNSSLSLIAMPLKQTVECLPLSDYEFPRLDARVVGTKQSINVIHRLCSNVGEFLDFGSSVLNLV